MTTTPSALELRVAAVADAAPGIRSVTLERPDGRRLPAYPPGSHLVLRCGERTNAYSLTGDGVDPDAYRISVLRIEDGQGGSRWVHDLRVGDPVEARLPRTAFAPVSRAAKHLLIAGGIGVTPILSHLRAAVRWGRPVQVLYGFRDGYAAHVDDLRELAGADVELLPELDDFTARLEEVLVVQPVGTHLYVCGPPAMIEHTLSRASELGWPESRLHFEKFGADVLDPGDPFTVVLDDGEQVEVPSGTSLLEALEKTGRSVPHLCRQGVCGECQLSVTGGRPLHRDHYLTDAEKAAGDALMACVSRADGPTLEVSLS